MSKYYASFCLHWSGSQAEWSLPHFSLLRWSIFSLSISPCHRAFPDPTFTIKHFLVCVSSMPLLKGYLAYLLVCALACLLPPSPLAWKLLEGQRQARPTPLSPAQSTGPGMWRGPFPSCRMNHPFSEDTSSKHSGYFYYLYKPQHFEPTALKGSFKHLMLELSSRTSIFKGGRMWDQLGQTSPYSRENLVPEGWGD